MTKRVNCRRLDSVSSVWGIADWHERETYDLVGIRFTGHPNHRRILCPEDWVGHPLRKDYEFPLEYGTVIDRFGDINNESGQIISPVRRVGLGVKKHEQ